MVFHGDGVELDGDASFSFKWHIVEHLRFQIALFNSAREFQNAVAEGAFAVIDVGDDGEISDSIDIECHKYRAIIPYFPFF